MAKKSPFIIICFGCFLLFFSSAVIAGGTDSKISPLINRSDLDCCPEEREPVYRLTKPFTRADDLRDYQYALKILGCYNGQTNGIFDKSMESAVRDFQRRRHLNVDGVLGSRTIKELAGQFNAGPANKAAQSPPKGQVEIVVNVDKKKLYILDNGNIFKEYRVAVGKGETPTPIGEFRIKRKALNWGTGFGTRWLGLDVPWGIYGIHGTNKPWSIGSHASHGCIRMFNNSVEEIYPWVNPGTKVTITGKVYSPLYEEREKVFRGSKGSAVVLVQQGLMAEGYLKKGKPDGIFGLATEVALKKLQRDRGFEVTGQVDMDIWPVLGL